MTEAAVEGESDPAAGTAGGIGPERIQFIQGEDSDGGFGPIVFRVVHQVPGHILDEPEAVRPTIEGLDGSEPVFGTEKADGAKRLGRYWLLEQIRSIFVEIKFADAVEAFGRIDEVAELDEAAATFRDVGTGDIAHLVSGEEVLQEFLADIGDCGILEMDLDGASLFHLFTQLEIEILCRPIRLGIVGADGEAEVVRFPLDSFIPTPAGAAFLPVGLPAQQSFPLHLLLSSLVGTPDRRTPLAKGSFCLETMKLRPSSRTVRSRSSFSWAALCRNWASQISRSSWAIRMIPLEPRPGTR